MLPLGVNTTLLPLTLVCAGRTLGVNTTLLPLALVCAGRTLGVNTTLLPLTLFYANRTLGVNTTLLPLTPVCAGRTMDVYMVFHSRGIPGPLLKGQIFRRASRGGDNRMSEPSMKIWVTIYRVGYD